MMSPRRRQSATPGPLPASPDIKSGGISGPRPIVVSGTPTRRGPHHPQSYIHRSKYRPVYSQVGIDVFLLTEYPYDPFIRRRTPSLDSRPPPDSPVRTLRSTCRLPQLPRAASTVSHSCPHGLMCATIGLRLLGCPAPERRCQLFCRAVLVFQTRTFMTPSRAYSQHLHVPRVHGCPLAAPWVDVLGNHALSIPRTFQIDPPYHTTPRNLPLHTAFPAPLPRPRNRLKRRPLTAPASRAPCLSLRLDTPSRPWEACPAPNNRRLERTPQTAYRLFGRTTRLASEQLRISFALGGRDRAPHAGF